MKSDESKIVLRYGLYKYIGEEIGVKKKYKKTWTQNTLPTKFFGFLIGYHSETTPPTIRFFERMREANLLNLSKASWERGVIRV